VKGRGGGGCGGTYEAAVKDAVTAVLEAVGKLRLICLGMLRTPPHHSTGGWRSRWIPRWSYSIQYNIP
jgi:hypothetical protein